MSLVMHRGGEEELWIDGWRFWTLIKFLEKEHGIEPGIRGGERQNVYYFNDAGAALLVRHLAEDATELDKQAEWDPDNADWCRRFSETCRLVAEWSKGGGWQVEV